MKKLLFCMLVTMVMCMMASCNGCDKKGDKQKIPETPDVVAQTTPNVEKLIALDREYVFLNFGEDYRWYETMAMFKDFFDSDGTSFELLEVVSVFQCKDTAIKCQHFDDKTEYGYTHALWVGDFDLSEEYIKLTFNDAYERMQQSNYVKPHGRYCVLRREVGPKPNVNPQYVFGNVERQLYVDAVTGDVKDTNPAFEGY